MAGFIFDLLRHNFIKDIIIFAAHLVGEESEGEVSRLKYIEHSLC